METVKATHEGIPWPGTLLLLPQIDLIRAAGDRIEARDSLAVLEDMHVYA